MQRSRLSEVGSLLVETALGKKKADLVVRKGTLVNVYSGEILNNMDVAVKGDRIAYVGNNADHTIGGLTKAVDASKRFVVPGFMDAHTHIDLYCTPTQFAQAALPHGTTAIFTEPDELANVLGFKGVKLFAEEVRRLPLRVYVQVPLTCPQDPAFEMTHPLAVREVGEALGWDDVVGLGEAVSWPRVLSLDKDYFTKFKHALELRKRIEGHTAGAKNNKLAAYVSAGIFSCHEPINSEQVIERLRLGMFVMLREGSLRRDLAEILPPLLKADVNASRMAFGTDLIDPPDLTKQGYMDFIVRNAIGLGLDPVRAIQMATINPAQYFRLDNDIGGIAPGRFADMTLIDDLGKVDVQLTISGGKVVAKDGKMLEATPRFVYPRIASKSIHVRRKLRPQDFVIKPPHSKKGDKVRVVVAKFVTEAINRQVVEEIPVVKGEVPCVPERDIMKVAVIDRHWKSSRKSLGFIQGFKAKIGALSSSLNFDQNNIVVIGFSDADMAAAANKVIDVDGGIAIASGGKVVDYLPMPIAGVMSSQPMTEVAEKMEKMSNFLKEAGCEFEKPLNTLLFLTFVTLPEIRITDRGLVDVKNHKFISLFPD